MKTTTDVSFAAYLRFRGIPLAGFIAKSKLQLVYQFQLSDEDWKTYKVMYNNSDISRHQSEMDRLKELRW